MRLILFALSWALACSYGQVVTVNTTIGPVHGTINSTFPNIGQFLGIPYAEAPTGDLRWALAVPKQPVSSINASQFGPSCPHFDATANAYTDIVPQFLTAGRRDEDCLSVSVWAPVPLNGNSALPVFAWIHGGGFVEGGADVPYQNPAAWVQRSKAHIVVAIQYRLGVFGFPNTRGLDTKQQNLGLLDQRLAVEWIRDNAKAFGGDPERITLWGQSAGAFSTDYYNFAYPDDPIISSLIMDSGTAFSTAPTNGDAQTNFSFVATALGCGSQNASAELSCMRSIPAATIESFLLSDAKNGTASLSFNGIVDNVTVFANYSERLQSGLFTRKPAIIGTNSNEGASLATFNATFGPDSAEAEALTLNTFLCPATQYTPGRFAVGATTYQYLYSGNFSNVSPRFWMGAYHSSELPMIFGTSGDFRGPNTPLEEAVSQEMQDLWLAFASDPINALPQLGWVPYTPNGTVLEFGAGSVRQNVSVQSVEALCS